MKSGAFSNPDAGASMWRRMAAFAVMGAVATNAYFIFSNVAVYILGLSPRSASVLVYVLLMPVSFFGHRRFTFASNADPVSEWARFCVAHAFNLMLAFMIPTIVVGFYKISPVIAFLSVGVAAPLVNFGMLQCWVFSVSCREDL